jgi:uncharacterized protein (TIGR00251 family)
VLEFSERDGAITLKVRVVPRASRSVVMGEHDGALRVRVAAPPVEGAANDELVRTLADALRLPARNIEIIGGHTSKNKLVRIVGALQSRLESLARGNSARAR